MNRGKRRRCPCCWRLVQRTIHERIEAHWDTAGALCPAGGEPYGITLAPAPRSELRMAS